MLFINQTFAPDPLASAQYLADWSSHLARQGHEVTVLTSRRAYHDSTSCHDPRDCWKGVHVIRVAGTGLGKAAKWRRVLDVGTFVASAFFRGFVLPRPDLIVALTSPPLIGVMAALLARGRGVRFVYWVLDLHPDAAIAAGWIKVNSMAAFLLEWFSRWSLHQAERIITLDRYMKERLISKGVESSKITAIPLWCQPDIHFDPEARDTFRAAHRWSDKYVVMLAGNHGICHPLDTLLEAAEELKDDPSIQICLLGGGTDWKRLQGRLGSNITLLEYLPRLELSGALSAADLHVVVMGDPMVGTVHPCKVYNIMGVQRPFLSIGPEQSSVADVAAQVGREWATCFGHGQSSEVAQEIRRRANERSSELSKHKTDPWQASVLLKKMTSALDCDDR